MLRVPAMSLPLRQSGALLAPCEDVSLTKSTTNVAKAEKRQPRLALDHDAHDQGTLNNRNKGVLKGASPSLPHMSGSEGNTFHVPPFSHLTERAGAGEFHLSSPPIISAIEARHDSQNYQ